MLLVLTLSFGLSASPVFADPPAEKGPEKTAPKDEKDKDAEEKKGRKKKDDEEANTSLIVPVDPAEAANLAMSLSAAVGALVALSTLPVVLKNSWQAILNLLPANFRENRKAWVEALKLAEDYLKAAPKLKENQGNAIERFLPAFEAYEGRLKEMLGKEPKTIVERYETVGRDLESLIDLVRGGKSGPVPKELEAVLEAWTKHRSLDPLEEWIDAHLQSQVLSKAEGRKWLARYVTHTLQLAAAYRLDRGGDVRLDEWIYRNEKRAVGKGRGEKPVLDEKMAKFVTDISGLRAEETRTAERLLREYNTFARNLHEDVKVDGAQLELLKWVSPREAGIFTFEKGEQVHAHKLKDELSKRSDCAYNALVKNASELGKSGKYLRIPVMVLQAFAPVLSTVAAGAGGYLAIRPYLHPAKKEEKEKAK